MKTPLLHVLPLILLFFISGPALASQDVTSPYVEKGQMEIKWKGGYTHDDDDDGQDGAWKEKLGIGYGVTERVNLKLEVAGEDPGDDDAELSSVAVESKVQLTEKGAYWLDAGARLKYQYNTSGGADKIEAKILLAKDVGKFINRANIILEREAGEGSDDDTGFGLSWSSRYNYKPVFQPGFEYYADFGAISDTGSFDEQEHQAGPVAYGKLCENVKYEAGYLIGLSDAAPDGEIKTILSYEMRF